MIPQRKGPSDSVLNGNFDALLKEFQVLWTKSPTENKKFIALAKKARNTELTHRQAEAIMARCENAINGTYGNTKKPEHYTKQP